MPPLPQTKKPWSKPELIVLVRGKPEEALLAACKWWYPATFTGPLGFGNDGTCKIPGCPVCNEAVAS